MDKSRCYDICSIFGTRRWFYLLVLCSQVVGIIVLILVGLLFGYFRGGFAWQSDPDKEFNYHPVLMTLGLIFFYGNALSLIFASIGLKAVFDSHRLSNPTKKNLYSIHGWISLITVILFGLQWCCGFASFLFPTLNESLRNGYMPSHKFWGRVIFMLAVGAVLTGITEYGIFYKLYSNELLTGQQNIINVFGISIITFALLILYISTSPSYERPTDQPITYFLLTDMESKTFHSDENEYPQ